MNKAVTVVLVLISLMALITVVAKPVFAVTADSWTEKAPMPTARGELGVASVNGKIYAIGGLSQNDLSGELLGTNEEYDPATNTWITRAPMPTPRMDFAIAVYNNQIYCMGGVSGLAKNQPMPGQAVSMESSVNEVYDPATNSWAIKTSLPSALRNLMANVIGEKIYIITSSLIYDPLKDSWSVQGTSSPTTESWNTAILNAFNETNLSAAETKMHDLASAAVGESIYVVPVNYRALVIYDSLTGNWTVGTPLPSAITGSAAAVATNGSLAPQQIYFQGTTANYAYNPRNDSWQTGVPTTTNRIDFGVVSLDDQLYVIGGFTGNTNNVNSTGANEQYTPIGYGIPTPTPTFAPTPKPSEQGSTYWAVLIVIVILGVIIAFIAAKTRNTKTRKL